MDKEIVDESIQQNKKLAGYIEEPAYLSLAHVFFEISSESKLAKFERFECDLLECMDLTAQQESNMPPPP